MLRREFNINSEVNLTLTQKWLNGGNTTVGFAFSNYVFNSVTTGFVYFCPLNRLTLSYQMFPLLVRNIL